MSLLIRGLTSSLIEQQTTGKLVLADRSTVTDIYMGLASVCDANVIARGTFGSGFRSGWVCTSSTAEPTEKSMGRLTISWEAGGPNATIPLRNDEFDLQPMEQYPRIERNPIFNGINTFTLALAYAAVQGPNGFSRANNLSLLQGLSDPNQVSLGNLLVTKLMRGEETFYMAAQRYVWTQYTYTFPQPLSLGGVVETPVGPLFGLFAPNSALRLADAVQSAGVNGSCYKTMRTWLIAPQGYWDPQLYASSPYTN